MESRTTGSGDMKDIRSGRVAGGIQLDDFATACLAFGYFGPKDVEY